MYLYSLEKLQFFERTFIVTQTEKNYKDICKKSMPRTCTYIKKRSARNFERKKRGLQTPLSLGAGTALPLFRWVLVIPILSVDPVIDYAYIILPKLGSCKPFEKKIKVMPVSCDKRICLEVQ